MIINIDTKTISVVFLLYILQLRCHIGTIIETFYQHYPLV